MRSTPTVVEAARECALLARARAVAAFVGGGRPVTAKAVLRRADSPAEAAGARHGRRSRVVSAQVSPRTLWGFDSLRDTSAQTVRSSGSAPVPPVKRPPRTGAALLPDRAVLEQAPTLAAT